MLLQQLVRTSLLVAETSSRLAKTELRAALLRQAAPEEIEIVIAYLSGSVHQAKLGVGWATLQAARIAPSETPSLRVLDVDATLGGAQVIDLMEALRASLERKAPAEAQQAPQAEARKPPKRAEETESSARKSAKK